jgi:hypothetical protein
MAKKAFKRPAMPVPLMHSNPGLAWLIGAGVRQQRIGLSTTSWLPKINLSLAIGAPVKKALRSRK